MSFAFSRRHASAPTNIGACPAPTTSAPAPARAIAPPMRAERSAGSEGPISDTPLLDGVEAEEEARGVIVTSTLRVGAKGPDVEAIQGFLGLEVDGRFGPETQEAVRAWQEANGLDADGVIGPESRARLAENAPGVEIRSTLRTGARGKEVEALQQYLGLTVDGTFGPQTRLAVIQFQMDHGLEPDGIIGKATRAALSGSKAEPETADRAEANPELRPVAAPRPRPTEAPATQGSSPEVAPTRPPARPAVAPPSGSGLETGPAHAPRGELRSRWHNDEKFVPKYASTAYSESSIFRRESDPYAVGAISNPTRRQDLGGKTYGVYQFESSVYRDGSTRGARAVQGSTAMRFLNWEGNPYGSELKGIVAKHGMASAEFDAAWRRISTEDNKAFGLVQEQFMEVEREKQVKGFFDQIGASEEVRKDPRLVDLVMGTNNQYGGLSKGIANHVRARNRDGKLSAEEIGRLIQDHKRANVGRHFRSSPGAHRGIYNRIAREKAMFQ